MFMLVVGLASVLFFQLLCFASSPHCCPFPCCCCCFCCHYYQCSRLGTFEKRSILCGTVSLSLEMRKNSAMGDGCKCQSTRLRRKKRKRSRYPSAARKYSGGIDTAIQCYCVSFECSVSSVALATRNGLERIVFLLLRSLLDGNTVQDVIRSDKFRERLMGVMGTWRTSAFLADYYMMHRRDEQVRWNVTVMHSRRS